MKQKLPRSGLRISPGKEGARKRILFVFGTRPEAIKLAPVILAFRAEPAFETLVCVTAQHREMLDQVLRFFSITADADLDLMQPGQSLFDVTANGLKGMEGVLDALRPDLVVVQGDTTTSFTGALAAFYKHIPVAHVEAGLRSGEKHAPFPEEMNRILAGHLADMHFAPTPRAADNLRRENVGGPVFTVGNTVIDALLLGLQRIRQEGDAAYAARFPWYRDGLRTVLITGHRRESFGAPFEEICKAIRDCAGRFPGVAFVYPVHLNPNVQAPVGRLLSDLPNVYLLEPLDYPELLWLMDRCDIVLTDSGGIQEEAPALGKPVLVMREVTERTEGIEAGTARLVGTDRGVIVQQLTELLTDAEKYRAMAAAVNPYGDGKSSARIVAAVKQELSGLPAGKSLAGSNS
jgi:UDP-N-acetylglucosamine 2-epimerase (non-hydrolysing)